MGTPFGLLRGIASNAEPRLQLRASFQFVRKQRSPIVLTVTCRSYISMEPRGAAYRKHESPRRLRLISHRSTLRSHDETEQISLGRRDLE